MDKDSEIKFVRQPIFFYWKQGSKILEITHLLWLG